MEGGGGLATGIPTRLTRAEGRKFGLTLGGAFAVVAAVMIWRGHLVVLSIVGMASLLLLTTAVVAPTRLGAVERRWMGMAHAISKVTTPIVMSVIYFLVIAPIGVLVRSTKGNPLVHSESQGGFWVDRSDEDGMRGNMQRQF